MTELLEWFTGQDAPAAAARALGFAHTGWLHEERDITGKWTHGATVPSQPGTERHGYQGKFMGYDPLVPPMTPADGRKALDQPGRVAGDGTAADPIDVAGNMGRAVSLMAAGKHVRLNSPAEIKPLLDEVDRQATAQGYSRGHEPGWDLGNISVRGTRLFNEQTRGIPRNKMPQLNGPALPGTEAALLAGGANRFIELDSEFRAQLKRDGIDVRNERVPAGNLRATQTQLTAATVAGITKAAENGNPKVRHMLKEPIWVTRDNYVIDGHHRWAADEALAFSGNGPDQIEVQRINLPVHLAIPYANQFAQQMGIEAKPLGNSTLVEGASELLSTQVLDFRFDPLQLRDDKGRWTRKPGTTPGKAAESLMPGPRKSERIRPVISAAEARGNSRPVSFDEFQHIAARGNQMIDKMKRDSSPIKGLDEKWGQIKGETFDEVRKPWGGATIDGHTGIALPQGADKYALSVKPRGMHSVSIPEHAGYPDFSRAMDQARDEFRPALERRSFYLGVFHDDELHRIDIDPVAVVDTPEEVEAIGAYTRAIGGAYHFKTGDGYWPPHVAEGAAMATPDTVHFAGPGQWRSQAEAVQAPEPEDDEGEDEPPSISGQVLQLAFHFNPLELRDPHGRWAKSRTEQMNLHKILRAAADPFVGAPMPDEPELKAAAKTVADKAARIVPGLVGGTRDEYNGKVKLFEYSKQKEILAEMSWDGTMNVADNVAQALQDGQALTDRPVQFPDAFEVIEHELIHGVVPEGSAKKNERAYQVFSISQIEEGFTELGAIQHAPEFFRQTGLYDREAGPWRGHTVGEMAENMTNPENITAGNTWGHYNSQVKDAQDWVQQIAKEEGSDPSDRKRLTTLADQVNQKGADGKIPVMAHQLSVAMTHDPKQRSDQNYMDTLDAAIMEAILKQWNTDNPDGAAKQAFSAAKSVAQQKMREMAEQGAAA